ncbi:MULTISPECIES: tRNA (N6-isopentenyl adenosine(37)-C2)-methylthiotransferase MiaB [unclassified Fusibacter]|uniref:tRNA (N6-isopentenyl adenosine(37)-C2)-methylthiotransferase MiaB n=1 Tax=unclassified Fusibacter TaxID=2624464 RepID=UPI001010C5E3|nr:MULTISPECIES: tRNA (N6-isopentenyl adenosine(37)-C2)-methylthiotransferase MiaB [unclassified Fusibacter]MCK8058830.1 tRNA (N6-isopentenyl adenosine(37)-C2)-methylthiotransferase MiaB [Fusibacter sp. A2]NPE21904.1 tRNA (N6-isopentenyl adenosine(37)-C2)-methylthiotransferase MiaB [Fusibacter sp. A1]RXV61475.1 tRNA (N6-isopentenyl adenosine(37)-C2)-methylthiotransferase MiaB [Fusibacter sp. A1]
MERKPANETTTEVVIENQLYIQAIRQVTDDFLRVHGVKPKYLIKTYGCQMNEHDSEKLAAMLIQMGYQPTENKKDAELIIYNTCCVRENAELKVFGNIGSLKPLKVKNPNLKIAVCGCMMQQEHIVNEIKSKYRHVDLVFGTHNLHTFPSLLQRTMETDQMLVDVWESEKAIVEGLPVVRKKELKAYLNIMYGCNNFCTYCIVPYTRGRERSRLPKDILHEASELIESGVKEITILGQNVNSYGKDLESDYSFADLLHDLDAIEGKFRIRFMTPHPKDISDEVIDAVASLESLCEYIHLPVQAGSDALLLAMNRKYTRKDYLDLVKKIRERISGVCLSTDIIIGFPGETEDDVKELIDLIRNVRFESAFTFIYSIREGTPAAKMTDQIDEQTKHDRFERMLKELNDIISESNNSMLDVIDEVLVEGNSRTQGWLIGRTRSNRTVHFEGDPSLIGEFVHVKITDPKNFSLYGERV